jgi:hypothetical protein
MVIKMKEFMVKVVREDGSTSKDYFFSESREAVIQEARAVFSRIPGTSRAKTIKKITALAS